MTKEEILQAATEYATDSSTIGFRINKNRKDDFIAGAEYAAQEKQGWVTEFQKAKLWSLATVTAKCWEWTGRKNHGGYGIFTFNGKNHSAHRVAYCIINNVDINVEGSVCHRCDNPACINPDHLFIGTHEDNMVDKQQKYRGRKSLSSSKYIGVSFRSDSNNWRAQIKVNGKLKSLGSFTSERDAAIAYDNAMIETHGLDKVVTNLNVPLPQKPEV